MGLLYNSIDVKGNYKLNGKCGRPSVAFLSVAAGYPANYASKRLLTDLCSIILLHLPS